MHTLKDIIENGGGTYNANGTIAKHNEGYYVGGVDCTIVELDNELLSDTCYRVSELIKTHLPNIGLYHYPAKTEDNYQLAGFWIDDNVLYIERVMHTINKTYAINTGKANNQIAIWDIVNQDTILV